MVNLGVLVVKGAPGVPIDAGRAKSLYEKAIDVGGHIVAVCNLGPLLLQGAENVPVDSARAVDIWERAIADGEHVNAMYNVGLLLETGTDRVPSDPVRAKGLHESGMERGHTASRHCIEKAHDERFLEEAKDAGVLNLLRTLLQKAIDKHMQNAAT